MPDVASGFPDMLDVLQASSPQIEERPLPQESDGTAEGTIILKSHLASGPRNLANANGSLLFTTHSPEQGEELWRSDGSWPVQPDR